MRVDFLEPATEMKRCERSPSCSEESAIDPERALKLDHTHKLLAGLFPIMVKMELPLKLQTIFY